VLLERATHVRSLESVADRTSEKCGNCPSMARTSHSISDGDTMKVVRLAVYDILGREVAVLVNEPKAARSYTVKFGASRLPSGVYFYKLQAGNLRAVKKLVLLK